MNKNDGPSSDQHPAVLGVKATLWSIWGSFILVIVKLISGVVGHSYALIADAIESASDVFSSFVVLLGLKIASKKPDIDHPYGHGKAEPLGAMVVSLSLIVAAIFISIQSIRHISLPHETPAPFTLVVLAVIIGVKEYLYRRMKRIGKKINSAAVMADAGHHRADSLCSLTAFIGIAIAITGGKGYENADNWAALVAAAICIYNAYRLFIPAFTEVMDAAPPNEITEEIKAIATAVPKVKGIEKCLVRKMGFEYFVDIHVLVEAHLTVKEGHDIGHMVKDAIIMQKPLVYDVLTHIEPF
jgi:cation diffusion facilitator family transporter